MLPSRRLGFFARSECDVVPAILVRRSCDHFDGWNVFVDLLYRVAEVGVGVRTVVHGLKFGSCPASLHVAKRAGDMMSPDSPCNHTKRQKDEIPEAWRDNVGQHHGSRLRPCCFSRVSYSNHLRAFCAPSS